MGIKKKKKTIIILFDYMTGKKNPKDVDRSCNIHLDFCKTYPYLLGYKARISFL